MRARAALAGGGLLLAYRFLFGPWQRRFGATADEARRTLPGDELIAHPTLVSTRAVSIEAQPDAVWPWLVQIGQGRGGFYSYDRLENLFGLEIESADRILRRHQELSAGDRVALAPDGSGLDVERIEEGRLLLLRAPDGGWTWAFALEPAGGGTRLIARTRWTTAGAPLRFRLLMTLVDPVAFAMERKMLRGIKARAEQAGDGGRPLPAAEQLRMHVEHAFDTRTAALAAWLLRATRGRIARLWRRRALVLTTRGRRTGLPRTVPLQYFPDGETMVVVAANSGLPRPPAWYLNLAADPCAVVDVDGRTLAARAEELPDDEAAAFWPRILDAAPDYARYPMRTSRRLPLVRLTPAAPPAAPG